MNKGIFNKRDIQTLIVFTILVFTLILTGCGGSSDGLPANSGGGNNFGSGTGGGDTSGVTAGTLTITANPTTIAIGEISTVTVTVLDTDGNPMPDGSTVSLALSNNNLGTIADSTTTINGVATVIFNASDNAGTLTINARAGSVTGNVVITILGPASITVTINPASISVGGTANVSAQVLDQNGNPMPDGTQIDFEVTNSAIGTVSPTVSSTSNGIATATFTAGLIPGSVSIIVSSGLTATGSAVVTIIGATNGSIEFTSATPTVIGIQGSGQINSSIIIFTVKDVNGNPVNGADVSFLMSGPSGGKLPANGGEYIGALDATPTTASSSTINGEAVVILNAGKVAGPVVITASTSDGSGGTISSASSPISIGGGVPSATHFTLASDVLNLPGLWHIGRQANISAYIADRFGNYNILEGTSVSFYAEAGAIDRNNLTDVNGLAVVTFRTQDPVPGIVAPNAAENAMCLYYETIYGIDVYDNAASTCYTAYHPRNGWAAITASVRGEESFIDTNGNGIYDDGTFFTDTPDEAFIDVNDSGAWNDGPNYPGPDQRELFIDDNGNGSYDGVNGIWDSYKTIFKGIILNYTGSPAYIQLANITEGNLSVGAIYPTDAYGGVREYRVLISDINMNPLTADTSISIDISGGDVYGLTSLTLPDIGAGIGAATEMAFTVASSGATCEVKPLFIEITVDWEGVKYLSTFSGTICN